MAKPNPNISSSSSSSIDPNSGFCSESKIYHSLRPNAPLPPDSTPLSLTDYVFSLLQQQHTSPSPETSSIDDAGLIDATTHHRIPYSELIIRTRTLASYLRHTIGLSKGDSALILSPNSTHIPILYLSLLSIGVIISPSNPASSSSEISRQIELSKPVIAFATSDSAHKISPLRFSTIVLDSPEFQAITTNRIQKVHEITLDSPEFRAITTNRTQKVHENILDSPEFRAITTNRIQKICKIEVYQSDPAAIFYSSGTTGKFKGVVSTHRNCISILAAAQAVRPVRSSSSSIAMCTVPYFHTYGFVYCLRAISMGQRLVFMKRFDLGKMMRAIEDFRVSEVGVAPPVAVAMVNSDADDVMDGCDLSSLRVLSSAGAALPVGVIEKFKKRFPSVQLVQGYGLTEASGGVSRTIGPNESQVIGTTGRLISNCQAKIVDPETGSGLPPFKQGELWVRGPFIMKGYIGDEEATAEILDSEGWFRTGDLCYFDNQGFLYFVDRLKDLIKYKAYQVAPAELEDLLVSHPDIVEAAVIPYPDEEAGQVPMAFLVKRSGCLIDESQIKDFIAKQVAPYKKIRKVCFVGSTPKNATGKVLRKELVKLALCTSTSKL